MSTEAGPSVIQLQHGETRIALHPFRDVEGPPLLLLHGLYANAATLQALAPSWPGPVFGIDLSGHGESAWRNGGAYSGELFAADADSALAEIARESAETVVLAGEGIGAYASLLLAGGRPERVRAAVLASGRGLEGAGAVPEGGVADFERRFLLPARLAPRNGPKGVDPRVAMAEFDPRPTDYAEQFAARAKQILLVEPSTPPPPWWDAIRNVAGVQTVKGSLASTLAGFTHD